MHIVSVYEWDLGLNRAALGLRRLHKLTEDHIRLSPRHRMRVKFAVQVNKNKLFTCRVQSEPGKEGKVEKSQGKPGKVGNFSEKLLWSGKSQGKIFCVPLFYILSIKFI